MAANGHRVFVGADPGCQRPGTGAHGAGRCHRPAAPGLRPLRAAVGGRPHAGRSGGARARRRRRPGAARRRCHRREARRLHPDPGRCPVRRRAGRWDRPGTAGQRAWCAPPTAACAALTDARRIRVGAGGTATGPALDVGQSGATTVAVLTRPSESTERIAYVELDGSPGLPGQDSSGTVSAKAVSVGGQPRRDLDPARRHPGRSSARADRGWVSGTARSWTESPGSPTRSDPPGPHSPRGPARLHRPGPVGSGDARAAARSAGCWTPGSTWRSAAPAWAASAPVGCCAATCSDRASRRGGARAARSVPGRSGAGARRRPSTPTPCVG